MYFKLLIKYGEAIGLILWALEKAINKYNKIYCNIEFILKNIHINSMRSNFLLVIIFKIFFLLQY